MTSTLRCERSSEGPFERHADQSESPVLSDRRRTPVFRRSFDPSPPARLSLRSMRMNRAQWLPYICGRRWEACLRWGCWVFPGASSAYRDRYEDDGLEGFATVSWANRARTPIHRTGRVLGPALDLIVTMDDATSRGVSVRKKPFRGLLRCSSSGLSSSLMRTPAGGRGGRPAFGRALDRIEARGPVRARLFGTLPGSSDQRGCRQARLGANRSIVARQAAQPRAGRQACGPIPARLPRPCASIAWSTGVFSRLRQRCRPARSSSRLACAPITAWRLFIWAALRGSASTTRAGTGRTPDLRHAHRLAPVDVPACSGLQPSLTAAAAMLVLAQVGTDRTKRALRGFEWVIREHHSGSSMQVRTLRAEIFLVAQAVSSALEDAGFCCWAFDEAEGDLVLGSAEGGDAVPVPFDHVGEALVGFEALPFEAGPPVVEEAARPGLAAIAPELAESLLRR